MGTRIESAPVGRVKARRVSVERVPCGNTIGYLITADGGTPRFVQSWAAVLDWFVQSMQPVP